MDFPPPQFDKALKAKEKNPTSHDCLKNEKLISYSFYLKTECDISKFTVCTMKQKEKASHQPGSQTPKHRNIDDRPKDCFYSSRPEGGAPHEVSCKHRKNNNGEQQIESFVELCAANM